MGGDVPYNIGGFVIFWQWFLGCLDFDFLIWFLDLLRWRGAVWHEAVLWYESVR